MGAEGVETMVAVGVAAKRQSSVQGVDRGRRGRHLPRFLSHLGTKLCYEEKWKRMVRKITM